MAKWLSILALVAALVFVTHADDVHATHNDFRFKWPYVPGASFLVTTYPYSGVHYCGPGGSCTDAWDIVIAGNNVRSSAEGIIETVVSNINPTTCNPADGGGYGNQVRVGVPTPTGSIEVLYAHLASTGLTVGPRILQGDQIGVQGHTGHTEGSDPGGCGTHLHFEFNPARPAKINGASNPGASTNYVVGAFNVPGASIRQLYYFLGAGPLGPSWGVVGWTTDFVRYAPNPSSGHWGSRQVFRLHPGTPVTSDGMIAAGRWAQDDPYWVKQGFYAAWLGGLMGIGLPAAAEVPTSFPYCAGLTGCISYQRFQHGYIWKHTSQGVKSPVFCPDVAPAYPNQDYTVDLFNDIQGVDGIAVRFGSEDTGAPHQPWADSWWDIGGDGSIGLFNDIIPVANAFGMDCYPG